MKEVASVDRFQVRQTAIDRLRILIVARGEFTAAQEAFLRDHIGRATGPAVRIDIDCVDDIPLTPSGKRRVTVSELAVTQP